MQQEEEEAEKGGRRKKEVEILREAEGKKGGSPVTAVESPPPPLHLSSSFSLTSPLFPLSPSLAHNPLPTCPSTPLQRTQQHPCILGIGSSGKRSRDADEGSFAGGRTGTSMCFRVGNPFKFTFTRLLKSSFRTRFVDLSRLRRDPYSPSATALVFTSFLPLSAASTSPATLCHVFFRRGTLLPLN